MKQMKIRANAKLNLYLDIIGKRNDGYHELKTVMQTINLFDELEFIISDGVGIEIFGNKSDIPLDENNLIYNGMMAVFDYAYFSPGCKITVNLKKNIPSQAGMGGGSADCAAAIIAMNELFHVGLDVEEMRTAAAMCGADVPFFIEGGTALCEGIGEKITRLTPINSTYFAVAKPSEAISTPEAYSLFDKNGSYGSGDYEAFEKALRGNNNEALGKAIHNAFDRFCELDAVENVKSRFVSDGALGAQMTGSGSAVFGIFDDKQKAQMTAQNSGCEFNGVYIPTNCGIEII